MKKTFLCSFMFLAACGSHSDSQRVEQLIRSSTDGCSDPKRLKLIDGTFEDEYHYMCAREHERVYFYISVNAFGQYELDKMVEKDDEKKFLLPQPSKGDGGN